MVGDISHSKKVGFALISAASRSKKYGRGNKNVSLFNSPVRVTSCSCTKRACILVVIDAALERNSFHSYVSDRRPNHAGDGLTSGSLSA